jgi:ATP-dependent helicase/nuclease subunit B
MVADNFGGETGMDLIFGLACDGRAYPDFPGGGEGALRAAVVGPTSLIDILEVQLGLTAPRGVEAVRIAAYAAKLRAALTTNPTGFYAASFARDPWATAKICWLGAISSWQPAGTAA